VRVDGQEVRASTLAGSIGRGATAEQDRALAAQLLASDKDRAEHEVVRRTMIEALEESCDDVTSEAEPSVLTLPQVHHLHTAVRARLRPGHRVLELVGRLHPTPAVGGSPREAALRFLRDHERLDRGWYAAPIGWMQRDAAEFAVALRSALIRGPEASLYAGCGIVADSDPDHEFAESEVKLVSMKLALAAAVGGASAPGAAESPVATSR
jgi:isochorismate synthase